MATSRRCSCLLLIVIAIIAGVYFWQQAPEPDDVLAQSYIAAFEETTNPTYGWIIWPIFLLLEVMNNQRLNLFSSLPADEQLALFENLTPDLAPQVRETVQGIYATLHAQTYGKQRRQRACCKRCLQR